MDGIMRSNPIVAAVMSPRSTLNSHKEVAMSCFDLLVTECVSTILAASSSTPAGNGNDDEHVETAMAKVEAIGHHLGHLLVERMSIERTTRLSSDVTTDTAMQLECMKFVCKEVWTAVFMKQIDNLKTNHRGVFVLQDNCMRMLARMCPPDLSTGAAAAGGGSSRYVQAVRPYLALPCGIIRGALAALGLGEVEVQVEASHAPSCTFKLDLTHSQPPPSQGR